MNILPQKTKKMFFEFMPKRFSLFAFLLLSVMVFNSCDDDEGEAPPEEEEVEVITTAILTFTDTAGNTVNANASDPDGEGVADLMVEGPINLSTNTTYTLTFQLLNELESPAEDIAEEVEEEDDEHQFFFSFSDGAFASPSGDGNIDTASDAINYSDEDDNGNPVGLQTSWTTPATPLSDGNFTVRLQHQPDIKTSTTGANDGDTDVDVTFVLNIQ